MGFMTQIVVHNDALDVFRKNPKGFGEAILNGIDKAWEKNRQVTVPFMSHANYIHIEPSRHADHNVLFISTKNSFHVIGQGEKDWEELAKRDPILARKILKKARAILKYAKDSIPHIQNK